MHPPIAISILGLVDLERFECADVAVYPLLGVFPHCTGVEDNKICLLHLIGQIISCLQQHSLDLLAVVDILLAAEGVHIGRGRMIIVVRNLVDNPVMLDKILILQDFTSIRSIIQLFGDEHLQIAFSLFVTHCPF